MFRIGAIEGLTLRRMLARDFAAAATWWREMVALRVKALGTRDASVILGLREVAILYALAGDDASAREASARSLAFERDGQPEPAVADFAEDPEDRNLAATLQLMPELAQGSLSALPSGGAEQQTGAQIARADSVAATLVDYAETQMRTRKDLHAAVDSYESALQLLGRSHEATYPATVRAALRLADLYEQDSRANEAATLRAKYRTK